MYKKTIKGKTAEIVEAFGYTDGEYWDLNARFKYDGELYSVFDIGSISGFISCESGIAKGELERLYGWPASSMRNIEAPIDEVWNLIERMLYAFEEFGAKESLEFQEGDFTRWMVIDGKEMEV